MDNRPDGASIDGRQSIKKTANPKVDSQFC